MSLQATLTLLAPDLRIAARAGWGLLAMTLLLQVDQIARAQIAGSPDAMPKSSSARATACTACSISSLPIAPMQPTRKVSTCVSLPG